MKFIILWVFTLSSLMYAKPVEFSRNPFEPILEVPEQNIYH